MKKYSTIKIDVEGKTHPVLIGEGALGVLENFVKGARRALVVSDGNVFPLYGKQVIKALEGAGVKAKTFVVSPGEKSKSLNILEQLYRALVEGGITREDVLIALGGGVVGDLGGFGAATYLRGIPYIQMPTSLLAQVDSSVGGKVAVDLAQGKNVVGAFYQPRMVCLEPRTLETLPYEYWVDGMGEVIKYGCIADEGLFSRLEKQGDRGLLMDQAEHLVTRCLTIKKNYVEKDPYDKKERMLLNFGHTFGHGIEGYQRYEGLSHGRGVAVGMVMAANIGEKLGITPKGTTKRIKECLITHGLPWEVENLKGIQLLNWIQKDKKKMGEILHLILLEKIGKAVIYPVKITELEKESLWKV